MPHMKVAEARARFGEILDEAEKGRAVVIERRGVLFTVAARAPARPARRTEPVFEFVDPAVDDGQWTWTSKRSGLAFSRRSRR